MSAGWRSSNSRPPPLANWIAEQRPPRLASAPNNVVRFVAKDKTRPLGFRRQTISGEGGRDRQTGGQAGRLFMINIAGRDGRSSFRVDTEARASGRELRVASPASARSLGEF